MSVFLLFLLIGLLGCCFGSFFMVVGLRIPLGQSIVHPASHCADCQHSLGLTELIPVFSFLLQKGRCRHCRASLSLFYPLSEIWTGFLFVSIALAFAAQPQELFLMYVLVAFSLIFSVTDLHYQLLPVSLMAFFFSLVLIGRMLYHPLSFTHYLLSALFYFSLFYALYWITDQAIGGGDVKLFGILGLFLGFKLMLFTLFAASLSLLLLASILLLLKKITRQTHLPFAPFIFFGVFFSIRYGEALLSLTEKFFI